MSNSNDLKAFITNQFNNLKAEQNSKIGSLENKFFYFSCIFYIFVLAVIITGLSFYSLLIGQQRFTSERITTLQIVTGEDNFQSCAKVTYFGLSYDNYMMDVTVSHITCDNGSTTALLPCQNVDIALVNRCPKKKVALDGRVSTKLELGDTVVAFGYSDYSNSWTGILSGKFGRNETAFKPFNDQANWPPDTHIFTGDQNKGMSGAPVLNSFGLVGLASAVMPGSFNNSRFVGVIPVEEIFKCVKYYGKQLPTKESCIKQFDTKIVAPPSYGNPYQTFQRLFSMIKFYKSNEYDL